jgi:elongation of very long chain fatty acids protein 4
MFAPLLDPIRPLAAQLAVALEFPDSVMYGVAARTYQVFGPAVELVDDSLRKYAPVQIKFLDDLTARTIHDFAKRLPLMTPSYVIFALIFYAVALLALYPISKLLGKQKLRLVGILHNAFLFFLSWYMCLGIFVTALSCNFDFIWNNPVGSSENDWRLAKLLWVFYVSKLPEFGDTFIMMLKQNYRQISFLHLYHHSTIFFIWFYVVSVGPGGDAYWSAMVNSGVHVVMYGYYFGTMLFETGRIRNFLNRFKFFITKGQMIQFLFNCFQTTYNLGIAETCRYTPALVQLLFVYMVSLLALFGNFLVKNSGSNRNPTGSPMSSPTTKSPPGSKNPLPQAAQQPKKKQ